MYSYYSDKHKCSVKKCPVCNYQYGKSYVDGRIRLPYGRNDFMKVTSVGDLTYISEEEYVQYTSNLYICPDCGTLGVMIDTYGS